MSEKMRRPPEEVIPLGEKRAERRLPPGERPELKGSADEVIDVIEKEEDEAQEAEKQVLKILQTETV